MMISDGMDRFGDRAFVGGGDGGPVDGNSRVLAYTTSDVAIASDTPTILSFGTEMVDVNSEWDTGSSLFTPSSSEGIYLVCGALRIIGAPFTASFEIYIDIDNTGGSPSSLQVRFGDPYVHIVPFSFTVKTVSGAGRYAFLLEASEAITLGGIQPSAVGIPQAGSSHIGIYKIR